MALSPEDKKRSIVPRWRSFSETIKSGELGQSAPYLRKGKDSDPALFEEKIREWQENRTLSFARQLVGSAVVLKRKREAQDAAEFILRSSSASRPARHLAEVVLGQSVQPSVSPDIKHFIREARGRTRALPSSPLPWVDLALGYTILGKISEARRAILIAVQYGKNSRFIVRCASRFFVHIKELDTAHDILCRAGSIGSDPWLLASESAVSFLAERKPRFFRSARRLVDQKAFHERHLNELLGALGTLEFQSGRARKAIRLFRRALLRPTENVLAQARWAQNHGLAIDISPSLMEIPLGYETRAWRNRYLSNWESSVDNSKDWLRYQQFQSTPALLGSFVAAVALEDHSTAIEIIESGLRANPSDSMLLNNLAYSSASKGDFSRAESALKSISTAGDSSREVYKSATSGLLRFRQGRVELGRLLYSQAAEKARSLADTQLVSRLMLFWALEEVRAGSLVSGPIPSRALELAKSDDDPIMDLLSERVRTTSIARSVQSSTTST